jgi:glycosyltransferase involved in cell wall biosynthesis
MDEHKCLVIPSLFETYSLVGWEGAARGMAVVANKAADMSETLEPVAELVPIENKEAFIEAIEIGLKGHKKSQVPFRNFTWDVIVSRIVSAYR